MTVVPAAPVVDGYVILDLLGHGGSGRVYRAQDPEGEVVALKILEIGNLTAADERRFLQEFRLAASLVHPNVLPVYTCGATQGVPYFTMEFLPGGHLREDFARHGGPGPHWLGRPDTRERFFAIVAGVLNGLSCIHAQRIVHRDLKPENILLAADGTPRIMDFGLARSLEASVRLTTAHTILGTIAYMSPEQVSSADVDPRSDLHALGIILYEWLSGGLPYHTTDLGQMITQILSAAPMPLHLVQPEIPLGLSQFVSDLLAKDPNGRPASADAALQAWHLACQDLTPQARAARPVPVEPTPAFFEPVFVGRELEMDRLRCRLDTLRQHQASLVFIGGESGVGKTRLSLELTRMAHLRGIPTLEGRCFEDVDVPFEAFQPVLRQALKGVPQEFAEQAGAVLGAVLPELDVPETERTDKFRLLETILRCLEMKASASGLLVILDDLQWADKETLGLLNFMARALFFAAEPRADLMIVVTYRTEEVTPDHPLERLMVGLKPSKHIERVTLSRLEKPDIERLVKSMLGGRAAPEGLLELLTHECEGNAFFVGEFLKAMLADHVLTVQGGEWCLRSQAMRWSPGGGNIGVPITIRDVVRRRLSQLSAGAVEVLRLCSVIGKEVPYAVLQGAWTRPEDELLEAAEELITGHLLVELPRRDAVTFYHAQIREVVLEDMPHLRRRALHRRVAEALEQWADTSLEPHLFDLAHHYTVAQVPERAVPYLLRAADQAFNAHAYERARQSLEQVFEMGVIGTAERVQAEEKRAQCLLLSGEYRLAREVYQELETRTAGVEKAAILRRMGRACEALGEHDRALECYHAGLAALGEKLKLRSNAPLGDAVGRLRRLQKATRPQEAPEDEMHRLIELRRLYDQMIQTYYFARVEKRLAQGLELALRHLKVSLTVGRPADIAQAWLTAAFILHHVALETGSEETAEAALGCLELTLQHANELPVSSLKARLLREVGYCLFVSGEMPRALTLLDSGLDIARRLNDVLGIIPNSAILGMVLWTQGNLARAVDVVNLSLSRSRTTENSTFAVLAWLRLARVDLVRHHLDQAEDMWHKAAAGRLPGWGELSLPVLLLDYVRGCLDAEKGDYDGAMRRLQASRQAFRDAGISRYDRMQLNFDTAMYGMDGGRDMGEVVQETSRLARGAYLEGMAKILEGRQHGSRTHFESAIELLRPIDCPRLLAIALVTGGSTVGDRGWVEEGQRLAREHGYAYLV
ncbi:MAG TPA: protein kinase [Candidatus Xenobia bacterium]